MKETMKETASSRAALVIFGVVTILIGLLVPQPQDDPGFTPLLWHLQSKGVAGIGLGLVAIGIAADRNRIKLIAIAGGVLLGVGVGVALIGMAGYLVRTFILLL